MMNPLYKDPFSCTFCHLRFYYKILNVFDYQDLIIRNSGILLLLNLYYGVAAGKPKQENALKSLCLMLGPDFITDIIEVSSLLNICCTTVKRKENKTK